MVNGGIHPVILSGQHYLPDKDTQGCIQGSPGGPTVPVPIAVCYVVGGNYTWGDIGPLSPYSAWRFWNMRDVNGGKVRLSAGGVSPYNEHFCNAVLWIEQTGDYLGREAGQYGYPPRGSPKLGQYQQRLSNGGAGQHQYQPFGRAAVALIVVRQLFIPDGSVGDGYGWDPTNKEDGPRWLSF